MRNYLLISIILIFNIYSLSAQKTQDVLYLKNGSIIYGNLIEIVSDQYKIKTSDGSIFNFSADEVEKFMKEVPSQSNRKNSGGVFALEAGLLIGAQESEYVAPFSFSILGGYTINQKNTISLGSGVEFIGKPYTPLFIEYKRLISDRRITPFVFVRGGALMQIGGDDSETYDIYNQYEPYNYKGGVSVGIGTGISWLKENYETYLTFAYRYAETSYDKKEYNSSNVTYKSYLNRIELKYGFRF